MTTEEKKGIVFVALHGIPGLMVPWSEKHFVKGMYFARSNDQGIYWCATGRLWEVADPSGCRIRHPHDNPRFTEVMDDFAVKYNSTIVTVNDYSGYETVRHDLEHLYD